MPSRLPDHIEKSSKIIGLDSIFKKSYIIRLFYMIANGFAHETRYRTNCYRIGFTPREN